MSEYLNKSKQYKGYHYSVLTSEMLEYLHSKTLEMFKEIKSILDQNGIRYIICGGTLLGALTTGKFIPWDDDLDMCVLDEDYDKMKELLLHYLPSWIEVQCNETEPHYYHGWIKVRDKGSQVEPNEPLYKHNGVWVDIYKLTKSKSKDVDYLIYQEHLNYLNRRCSLGCLSEEERDKRIKNRDLERKIKDSKLYAEQSTDDNEVYIIWSASKILVEPEWVLPLSECTFEGLPVYTFCYPEAYIVRHYGEDYMNLPPDEMRRVSINKVNISNNQQNVVGGVIYVNLILPSRNFLRKAA